jgi:chlorophyllase
MFQKDRAVRISKLGYDPDFYIDHHNSFIGGHSAGCHVPVAQLQAHCLNFRGQVLLSPVDGADPFGYIPIAVITPGEKVNFTIPTLQMVVGLDPVPGNFPSNYIRLLL